MSSNTREVTISARELASLAGRPLKDGSQARYNLSFGISTGGEPSSTAHYYARWLSAFAEELEQALGERVRFQIKLYKQFNEDEDTLASGTVDCMVLSAVDFLNAQSLAPGVTPMARVREVNAAVIFARTNAEVRELKDLAGKTIVFPDPDLPMSVWAKARLVTAGLQSYHLRQSTDIADQGLETGHLVISFIETVNRVLRGEADAGVTYRERFERCKHLGLVMLDHFPETPNVLATRQGLEPELVRAFTNAVRALERKPKVDLLTTHGAGPMVSVGNAEFAPLRHAFELARKFDGQPPGRHSTEPATVAK